MSILKFITMSTTKSNKTFEVILRVVIALASALAGALGYGSLS